MKWFARAAILSFELGILLLDRISSCQGACDVNCASGCAIQGQGKCDSSCKTGYLLITSNATPNCYTCREMNYFNIPASYSYHRVALNLSTRNSIVISVKVSTDFYVGLTRDPDSYIDNTMYKIIIGGLTNTQSVIRKSDNGANLLTVSTPNFLNANTFNSFWISWIDGVIRVGNGTVVGNGTFMTYTDASPSPVNYIALSDYVSTGSAFINDECDVFCASGCAIQGPGKCDTSCKMGYSLLTSDGTYTCIAMNYFSIPGIYDYYNRVALDLSIRNFIVISVKMCCDFYVILTRDPDSYTENTMYKIAIGGWGNSKSVIRKKLNGADLVTASTPYFLDANSFNSFWISWINGVIQVGKGNVVGNGTFMSYNDTSPSAVNYVALSAYSTPGSAFFNDDCDVYCASGCAIQGPGKCDKSCKMGYFLVMSDGPYTCKAMNYFSIPGNNQYNPVAFNVSTRNSIVISARISNDFTVGLTRDPDSYVDNTMYEVTIGGWTNYFSVIRKNKGGTYLASASTLNFLNANLFNAFWISWINGVIQVGKGTVVGNGVFMSYIDTSPSAVNYVAFRGDNSPGSAFFNNVCDTNCMSGCSVQGPKKCDSACSSGFVLVTAGNAYICADDTTKSNNKIFNRHANVRLGIPSMASPVAALSRIHCCALCRKISGCRSVNYHRRSSKGNVNCVPLGVSAITMCMTVIDYDWDWFSVDN